NIQQIAEPDVTLPAAPARRVTPVSSIVRCVMQILSNKDSVWPAIFVTVVGLYIFSFHQVSNKGAEESGRWPTIRGIITRSDLEWHPGRLGGGNVARVAYRYQIAKTNYDSEKVSWLEHDFPENIVRQYPKGKSVAVFYNPRNYGESVLEPGSATFDV